MMKLTLVVELVLEEDLDLLEVAPYVEGIWDLVQDKYIADGETTRDTLKVISVAHTKEETK